MILTEELTDKILIKPAQLGAENAKDRIEAEMLPLLTLIEQD